MKVILSIISMLLVVGNSMAVTPLVMWHGMGDTCCNPLSLGAIKEMIEKTVPGIYVLSLKIGSNFLEDEMNGFFKDANIQIEMACNIVSNDTRLANGFNAMGFSQGGQFLRALVQRCKGLRVNNLISIGGQHQGVYGLPHCPVQTKKWICDIIRRLLNHGAYTDYVQDHLVQAQYWHDPLQQDLYVKRSKFIAEINQEQSFNPLYKTNLLKINNFVMVKFLNDTMVVPRESEWFGFYTEGQAFNITQLRNSTIYQKDLLGLKELDVQKKLKFLSVEGDHLRFTETRFVDNIVRPYLSS